MITKKDLTTPPATEPVLVGTPEPEEAGYLIPAPEDAAERARFEAAVAHRAELGLSPFVGEDPMPVPAAPASSDRADDSVRITTTTTAVAEVLAMHDRYIERGTVFPIPFTAAIEQLRQAARLDAPQLMTVRVLNYVDRRPTVTTITVPAVCISCGGPRGRVRAEQFQVLGERFVYDVWSNGCGHRDTAEALLREANRYHELVTSRIGGE